MTAYIVRHYVFTLSILRMAKNKKPKFIKPLANVPLVSILVPARNEEKVVGRLLNQITNFTYPKDKLQVVVMNDASSDQTGKIADSYSEKYPYIKVIHREKNVGGKGKASAMNQGLRLCQGEIVLCFDADYFPQNDIVEKLIREFQDPKVGAVQGRVVVINEPQNIVTRLVALERIGGYRIDQEARDSLGLIVQFGGTVGGFRRSLLESLRGWDESVLAEDTDLTFRVYLSGYKIKYCLEAECYEEAVDSWYSYRRQRYRWAKGHMQCYFKHAWNVIKSPKLSLKEKIDGSMLLSVYFMPILVLLSLLVGLPLVFLDSQNFLLNSILWLSIPICLYSFVGNFAPFFEVGAGLYIDGRTRAQWLIPSMIFTFFLNIPICLKAFFAVLLSKISRKSNHVWEKTIHTGNGNFYVKEFNATKGDTYS